MCFRQQRVVVNGVKSDWAPVVSGVPQGTVLGPLLFSLYINDIPVGIDSQIRLFADDCVRYREIRTVEDTLKLQKDIDLLGSWARKWGMRFQPVKCNIMQLTNKRINKIEASYTLEGTVLENVDRIKYLGVTITNDLKWNTHIHNICTKANRTLGFLRRNLLAHLSRRLTGELIVCPCSGVRRPSSFTISKIFSSETAWPIEAKLHVEHP